MSISSSTRKAGPYSCNGATVVFPFSFKVFSTADVRVVLADAAGLESDLVLGADYTVALNSDQDATPGGTVTSVTSYAAGYKITLTSQLQNLQPVVLTNQGGFYPKVINDALDRLTILVQQLAEKLGRSLSLPISNNGVSATLPAPSPGQMIGWSGDGLSLTNYTGLSSTAISAPMTPVVQGVSLAAARAAMGIDAISTATGTADALIGSYTPSITALANGMKLYLRAASANATTTPTFTPNTGVIPAKQIVKGNGVAVAAGDIIGAGHWIELHYDQTLDKWVLFNPSTGVSSVPAGAVVYVAQSAAPAGYLKANGAAVSRTTYAALFAAIGTAFGAGDGSTTFNIPDLRAEFIRGLDDSRGVDTGRSLGSSQAGDVQTHNHEIVTVGQPGSGGGTGMVLTGTGSTQGTITTYIVAYGGTETRPRNVALLACIKY